MAGELRNVLSRIEDLLTGDGTSGLVDRPIGRAHCHFPEMSKSPNDGMSRIKFKRLDKDTLADVRRLTTEKFSDSSEFQGFANRISELALDTDQEDIGDALAKEDLFIIPIVDEEHKIVGRSVFAFVR